MKGFFVQVELNVLNGLNCLNRSVWRDNEVQYR